MQKEIQNRVFYWDFFFTTIVTYIYKRASPLIKNINTCIKKIFTNTITPTALLKK